jgi:nucleoredoxin
MSPLSQKFPSLSIPLQTSRVLGLYFAASWCPDCIPVSPRLKAFYNQALTLQDRTESKFFEVVYVTSDMNSQQMEEDYRNAHANWPYVHIDNTDELKAIKRHFGVCAGKEAPLLGLTGPGMRKSGIPTLLLLNSRTEKTISTNGVDDILSLSVDDALEKWNKLLE